MFIGRQKELNQLTQELSDWKRKTAVLIYGKRRVGKSTLIKEAAKGFDGIVINHLCVSSTFEGNLELICRSVSDLQVRYLHHIYQPKSISNMFTALINIKTDCPYNNYMSSLLF